MINDESQQALLMAQLSKRRAMKQKYLRQDGSDAPKQASKLAGLVLTNAMFLAIKEHVDIFGVLRQIRGTADPEGDTLFGTVMGWIETLAEALDCSVYELFLDDEPKRRKILLKLLRDLNDCDGWENIRMDDQGNGSFALLGFDYAYRMTEQPSATLLFEKAAPGDGAFRYTLTLSDGRQSMDLIPSQAQLWQELHGPLQEFTDRVLSDLNSGWLILKEQFDLIRQQIQSEAEKLRDLSILLDEVPAGMNIGPLLKKEAETLTALREQEKAAYGRMPEKMKDSARGKQARNALILLGGAVSALEHMSESIPKAPGAELSEIIYMLENAGAPV